MISTLGYNYTTHRILLSNNIYAIENLANPALLPTSGAKVTVMPIRIQDGSGAAARIVGLYDDQDQINAAGGIYLNNIFLVISMVVYISLSKLV